MLWLELTTRGKLYQNYFFRINKLLEFRYIWLFITDIYEVMMFYMACFFWFIYQITISIFNERTN